MGIHGCRLNIDDIGNPIKAPPIMFNIEKRRDPVFPAKLPSSAIRPITALEVPAILLSGIAGIKLRRLAQ